MADALDATLDPTRPPVPPPRTGGRRGRPPAARRGQPEPDGRRLRRGRLCDGADAGPAPPGPRRRRVRPRRSASGPGRSSGSPASWPSLLLAAIAFLVFQLASGGSRAARAEDVTVPNFVGTQHRRRHAGGRRLSGITLVSTPEDVRPAGRADPRPGPAGRRPRSPAGSRSRSPSRPASAPCRSRTCATSPTAGGPGDRRCRPAVGHPDARRSTRSCPPGPSSRRATRRRASSWPR